MILLCAGRCLNTQPLNRQTCRLPCAAAQDLFCGLSAGEGQRWIALSALTPLPPDVRRRSAPPSCRAVSVVAKEGNAIIAHTLVPKAMRKQMERLCAEKGVRSVDCYTDLLQTVSTIVGVPWAQGPRGGGQRREEGG